MSVRGARAKPLQSVRLFAAPWTVAPQAPLSRGSPGRNTGEGCPALLPGIFPTQGSYPHLTSPAGGFFTTSATWEAPTQVKNCEAEQDLKFSKSSERQERKHLCASTAVITAGVRCWALQLFRPSVMSDSLRPQGLRHARPPCPSPAPWSLPKFMSIASVMPFLLRGEIFFLIQKDKKKKMFCFVCKRVMLF